MVSVQNPSSAASKKHTLPTRIDICFRGKGRKRIIQANEPRKYEGVAILMSVKTNRLQTKTNQKELGRTVHTHQKKSTNRNIEILNIYTPNTRAPKL